MKVIQLYIHMFVYVYFFLVFISIMAYYSILNTVLCAIQ